MKIGLRQKINIFISAAVSGSIASMIAGGYGLDEAMLFWTLGGLLIAAGLATMLMDVMGRQITTGSSDVILGVEKIAAGVWVLVAQKAAMENAKWLLAAIALYHSVYLVQQAVEVRRLQRSRMEIFVVTAMVSLVAALGIAFLPVSMQKYLDAGSCLLLDCAALVIAGVSLLLVRAPKEAPKAAPAAKAAAAPRPAAPVRAAAPAQAGSSADTGAVLIGAAEPLPEPAAQQPAAQEAASAAETPAEDAENGAAAAPEAAAEATEAAPAAETAPAADEAAAEAEEAPAPRPAAARQAEDRANTAAANDALRSFGRMAGKFRDRTVKTFSGTVSGFKEGMQDGQKK